MKRLCVRLAIPAVLLAFVAMGLIYLRTDTMQAGNRLHSVWAEKRNLEKACCRLELSIANLKNQERLRQQAVSLLQADEDQAQPVIGPRKNPTKRDRTVVADTRKPGRG